MRDQRRQRMVRAKPQRPFLMATTLETNEEVAFGVGDPSEVAPTFLAASTRRFQ